MNTHYRHTHYLQHVPFEGLGCIQPWLEQHAFDISVTRLFAGDSLPDPETVEFLIVMGGPMGVHDQAEFPWLVQETAFIREMVLSGKPVLGICLGAQLIASAMGARVFQNKEKEIGWFPVRATGAARAAKIASGEGDSFTPYLFPQSLEFFHWHGETFDLPEGAVHLARSEACEHQAFQIGERVMGLQFHPETTPQSARAMIDHCGREIVAGPWIQTAQEILDAAPHRCRAANRVMDGILSYLTRV